MNGNRITMKKTAFLLAFAGLAGVLAVSQLGENPSSHYLPRTAQPAQPVADATGMEQVLLALRSDVETGEMNHDGLRQLGERTRQVASVQSANRSSGAHYWNPMGPDNVGGRTRCILAVNELQLITGGASGRTLAFMEQRRQLGTHLQFPFCDGGLHCHGGQWRHLCGHRYSI